MRCFMSDKSSEIGNRCMFQLDRVDRVQWRIQRRVGGLGRLSL